MSISSEITRLTQAKADIKTAIENKGVTVPTNAKLDDYPELIDDIEQGSTPNLQTKSVSITENGTTTVEPDPGYDGLSEVGVSVNVQGGGGSGTSDDVRFIDYDGTVLHTYSADEFLSLTAMPENPTHEGLTSQGWNWSLADAKEQVTNVGSCDIGQTYITDDGKTRIYIELHKSMKSVYLGINVNGIVVVDWGDGINGTITGSSLSTVYNASHNYSSEGNYTITLTATSGTFGICGESYGTHLLKKESSVKNSSTPFANAIKQVFLGSNVSISTYAFFRCRSLKAITIPDGVTNIANNSFADCFSLESITIPDGVTSIDAFGFRYCYSLESIAIPNSITNIGNYAFQNCSFLDSISLPNGVTDIGTDVFSACSSLESITIPSNVTNFGNSSSLYALKKKTIPNLPLEGLYYSRDSRAIKSITIPDGITNIVGYAFQNCYSLESITIPDGVTNIGNYAFQNCHCLDSISLPNGVTDIGTNAFQNCESITSITIQEGVTNIGNYAFSGCHALNTITIPASVTKIGNYAFQNCYGLSEYHFRSTSPPTLGGSSVFYGYEFKIYVPSESLQAYKSATNWSSHSTRIVGE